MICLQCAVKRTTLRRCVKPSSVAVPCLLSIQWAIWPKIHKSLFNNFTSSNCEICCIQRLSSISSLRIFWTWMIYHSHRSKKRFLEAISLDVCKWVVVFPCLAFILPNNKKSTSNSTSTILLEWHQFPKQLAPRLKNFSNLHYQSSFPIFQTEKLCMQTAIKTNFEPFSTPTRNHHIIHHSGK